MRTIQQLVARYEESNEAIRNRLVVFANHLLENNCQLWSETDSMLQDSARRDTQTILLTIIGNCRKQDKSDIEILEGLRSFISQQVLNLAGSPEHSTAPIANIIGRFVLAAWAARAEELS